MALSSGFTVVEYEELLLSLLLRAFERITLYSEIYDLVGGTEWMRLARNALAEIDYLTSLSLEVY